MKPATCPTCGGRRDVPLSRCLGGMATAYNAAFHGERHRDSSPGAVQLARYREDHVIRAEERPGLDRYAATYCAHDGIRVHPVRGGWRHDQTEIALLGRSAAS